MGSKTVIVDHNVLFQLWSDRFFWELAPDWADYRETAEAAVAAAEEDRSSLLIKHHELYNIWMAELERCVSADPAKVQQITDYIHRKRKYQREQIVLPATKSRRVILLSNGVETWHDESD